MKRTLQAALHIYHTGAHAKAINRCLLSLNRSYLLPIDRAEEHRQRLITLAVAIRVHFQLPLEATNLKHITAPTAHASVRSSLPGVLLRPGPATAHRAANAQQQHRGACGSQMCWQPRHFIFANQPDNQARAKQEPPTDRCPRPRAGP